MTKASNPTVALNWIDGAWVGAEQVRESIRRVAETAAKLVG
jgi:hypothetical protein